MAEGHDNKPAAAPEEQALKAAAAPVELGANPDDFQVWNQGGGQFPGTAEDVFRPAGGILRARCGSARKPKAARNKKNGYGASRGSARCCWKDIAPKSRAHRNPLWFVRS